MKGGLWCRRNMYILVLLFYGCVHKQKETLLFLPEKQSRIVLEYGILKYSSGEAKGGWGAVVEQKKQNICINSHNQSFYQFESGPFLSICFDDNAANLQLLTDAISILQNQHNGSYRPEGDLNYTGGNAKLYFSSRNLIVNEMKTEGVKNFIAGDIKLGNALIKENLIEGIFFNQPGRENAESSWSLPYFSMWKKNNKVKIVFPSIDLIVSASLVKYLIVEFTDDAAISEAFDLFLKNIKEKNQSFRTQCSKENPDLTEVMALTGTVSHRYIEFKNKLLKPICLENLSLSSGTSNYNLISAPIIFLPGAVKIFQEQGAKIEGIEINSMDWSIFKSAGRIKVSNSVNSVSIEISDHVYRWGAEYFVYKPGKDCRNFNGFYLSNEKFCGDPGGERNAIPTAICQTNNFSLNELNPFGIKINGQKKTSGKFIELAYHGDDCNLYGLDLNISGQKIPFTYSTKIIHNNEILLIGDDAYFTKQFSGLLDRNVSFMNIHSTIKIVNRNELTETLLYSPAAENYAIGENISSLIPYANQENIIYLFHSQFNSNFLSYNTNLENSMSPGETSSSNSASGKINEISWAGSYLNQASIADDEFIEIKVSNPGTFMLDVNGTRVVLKSENELYTLLCRSAPVCFYSNRCNISRELILPNDGINFIKLYDMKTRQLLDEKSYNTVSSEGINLVANKTRKSWGDAEIQWKNSAFISSSFMNPSCPFTAISPGFANHFQPYLIKENNSYKIYHSPYSGNVFNVRIYSAIPAVAEIIQVNQGGEINLPQPGSDLKYVQIDDGSELSMIHPVNDIRIEALQPVPVNSQSEWVLLCNHGRMPEDLSLFEIKDSASFDTLTSWNQRNGLSLSLPDFDSSSTVLHPGHCAYILDPDMPAFALNLAGNTPALILTVATSGTIGNGISASESLDLFKNIAGVKHHIHSYGNALSHAPFSLKAESGQTVQLKQNHSGISALDYEVF